MISNNLKIITIITTDKCSAACTECCFQCSPKKTTMVSLEQAKEFILNCKKSFSNLETVVFTGGECTLWNPLFDCLNYCNELGLSTRIVTNGFWANTAEKAELMANKLYDYRLNEINFSTGDNHQEWVPFENIVNALIACVQKDIFTVVTIESHKKSVFSKKSALENEKLREFLSIKENNLRTSIFESVWIPFHNENILEYTDSKIYKKFDGCETLFNFLGLYPTNEIKLCCGLTVNYIKEMTLKNFNYNNLKSRFEHQLDDFLKIWIFVDGAKSIYDFALSKSNKLERNPRLVHDCQYCAEIYNNNEIKNILYNNWHEIVDMVMFRYHLKMKKNNIKKLNEVI